MNYLREHLHRLVDNVPVGAPPLDSMLAVRRPRRWLAPVAAAAAVAAVMVSVVIAQNGATPDRGASKPSTPPPVHETGWHRLPDPPLSPRANALGAFVGGRVLVLGGSDAPESGGPYRPPTLRDGAALDPQTQSWQPIATAPWAPATAAAHEVVGNKLLLARNGPGSWLLYDSGDNSWHPVPAPPQPVPQPTMATQGDRVFVLDRYASESPAPVQVLDLSTLRWSALPPSAYRPAIDDRTLVATDSGLVVMGGDLAPRQAGKNRQPALAEIWNGKHWTRYQSDHASGLDWHWTGQRIISTYRVTQQHAARGGLYDFRAGGFDPATGRWTQLPWLPPDQDGLLQEASPTAYGPWVLSLGYLYNDRTGTSLPIPSPSSWDGQLQLLTSQAIVLVGGARPKPGQHQHWVTQLDLTNQAWILPLN
jgi:hypothetical protein